MNTNEKKNKRYALAVIALIAAVAIGSFWIDNPLVYAIIIVSAALSVYLLAKFFLWITKILQ